jgi:hypothetical protein
VDITTETLQSFLDDAWDAAPSSANSLRDQLRSFEKAVTAQYSQGSIASVSKNSFSQTYRGPGLGSYTLVQIANAWRTLINLFDEEKQRADFIQAAGDAWFIAKFPNYSSGDSPDTDPAIYDLMKNRLFVITEYQTDLSDLRLRPTLAGEGVRTW